MFENDSKVKYPDGLNIHRFKIVEFKRGHLSLFAKVSYDDEMNCTEIHFLKKKSETDMKRLIQQKRSLDEVPKQTQPRGICEAKKTELLKLCETIPQSRRKFYEDLVVSDVPDLSTEKEIDF